MKSNTEQDNDTRMLMHFLPDPAMTVVSGVTIVHTRYSSQYIQHLFNQISLQAPLEFGWVFPSQTLHHLHLCWVWPHEFLDTHLLLFWNSWIVLHQNNLLGIDMQCWRKESEETISSSCNLVGNRLCCVLAAILRIFHFLGIGRQKNCRGELRCFVWTSQNLSGFTVFKLFLQPLVICLTEFQLSRRI